ncbi:MAG: hypothetical protein K5669_12595 [Lachnospiraceae bacterium]|nr:hypothetical protein [Lachnospiraceae bacterium]
MKDCKIELKKEIKLLDSLIEKAEKRIRNNNDFEGEIVYGHKRENGYQYYFKRPNGKREYIKKADRDIARKIIQKDYDRSVLKIMIQQRKRISSFVKSYDISKFERAFSDLSVGRKELITPIYPTDAEFIKSWEQSHAGNINSFPNENQYLTDRGERVRSKSEKILADMFFRMKVPYCYEPKVELKNGKNVYPDFALLNLRERRTIYWEHFGLIDDGEYAMRALKKIKMYEACGYEAGYNLLFSMESGEMPLDTKFIEEKIREKLL